LAGSIRGFCAGALAGPRLWAAAFLVVFCLVRTAYFTHVETPEPRYVLECLPAFFALGALLWSRRAETR